MMQFNLFNGDCLDVLKRLPDNSVDSIVTDPPYGLSNQSQDDIVKCLTAWLADEAYTHGSSGFMGKNWDSFVPSPTVWKECLRVLKHGGYIACFAGSRTQDLMGMSLRLAGFELRDTIMWVYASGFPKGLDIAKGIDKNFNKQPKKIGTREDFEKRRPKNNFDQFSSINPSKNGINSKTFNEKIGAIYELQTEQAKQWEGWNTQLKPAYESILLARKPLDGTVVNNVLKHGVGGLNIGACRVETDDSLVFKHTEKTSRSAGIQGNVSNARNGEVWTNTQGRYPANLIHDGSESVEALFPETPARQASQASQASQRRKLKYETMGKLALERSAWNAVEDYQGSASRYFYCAKASKADRDEGLKDRNTHSTVKPTALMQYVTKLITPLNGTVLDPFMGSGSTGKACMLEGFNFTGIELNPEYITIAEARIKHAQSLASRKQLKLDV